MKLSITLFLLLTSFSQNASALSTASSSLICNARSLGNDNSGLVVSDACLGTMTFGVQNNQEEAFEQLEYAISQGVNFIDTAEMYPVPLTAPDWQAGRTEEILGSYVKHIGANARNDLVIASKVCGFFPKSPIASARTVPPTESLQDCRLDEKSVKMACDASLRRLQTDRIDLMQLHWPDRYAPIFGQTEFKHDNVRDDAVVIEETAAAMRDLIEEGKIRYIGLSNETPYGVCEWVKATENLGILDKLVSIQNSYSLLDRRFDSDLAEACNAFKIGLLPWSILAGGLLSGKYREGKTPSANSRFIKHPEYMTRWSPKTASKQTLDAVEQYSKLAEEAGMTPVELSIVFCRTRRFISDNGSTIVGAVTMDQLKENLKPFDGSAPEIDDDLFAAINEIHIKCQNPSCSL